MLGGWGACCLAGRVRNRKGDASAADQAAGADRSKPITIRTKGGNPNSQANSGRADTGQSTPANGDSADGQKPKGKRNRNRNKAKAEARKNEVSTVAHTVRLLCLLLLLCLLFCATAVLIRRAAAPGMNHRGCLAPGMQRYAFTRLPSNTTRVPAAMREIARRIAARQSHAKWAAGQRTAVVDRRQHAPCDESLAVQAAGRSPPGRTREREAVPAAERLDQGRANHTALLHHTTQRYCATHRSVPLRHVTTRYCTPLHSAACITASAPVPRRTHTATVSATTPQPSWSVLHCVLAKCAAAVARFPRQHVLRAVAVHGGCLAGHAWRVSTCRPVCL